MRQDEAKRLWQKALRFPPSALSMSDRVSIYSGLCRHVLESSMNEVNHYIASFYCTRAQAMYRRLSPEQREKDGESKMTWLGP